MKSRFLPLLALFLSISRLGLSAPEATQDINRLVATGKLWITIKYFHPFLGYKDVDWDKALADSLPKIRQAQNANEYAAAVQTLLDVLRDPATFVRVEQTSAPANHIALKYDKRSDGTLVISQTAADRESATLEQQKAQLGTALAEAHNVVIDLRPPLDGDSQSSHFSQLLDSDAISSQLATGFIEKPSQRTWVHQGLMPSAGPNPGDYHSAFYIRATLPQGVAPSTASRNVVFLLGQNSQLPEIACSLFAQGKAAVLTESPHYAIGSSETITLDMGEQVKAIVRLSEPVFSDGTGLPDVTMVPHDTALTQAISAATHPPTSRTHKSMLPPYPLEHPDKAYEDTLYPAKEYRILAAYKIWGVFRNFFAYRDLMDEDWDQTLADFLPKFEAAKDSLEYNQAVSELLTHVDDSHTTIESKVMSDYFGVAPTGLRLRLIERKPVVAQILDEDAKKAGVQIGEIVAKVDGEDIVERLRREVRYIPASTPQSLGLLVMSRILNGPEGSTATLTIRNADGQAREVKLVRKTAYAAPTAWRTGDIVKMLPGNLGYVDLERLDPKDIDGIFEKLRETKGIIFDARGSLSDTTWMMASRLTEKQEVATAFFNGPLTRTPDLPTGEQLSQSTNYFYVQTFPPSNKPSYKGKTVMLIDERTIDSAEHAGLAFEAANKTAFIGSPSAGADTDQTNFVIPGGILIHFSGRDVRHSNSGQLQRLGIQPTQLANPTVDDIRKGVDTALTKAIEYLQQ